MGDFNYPDIDWENWNTKENNTNSHECKFIETIQDNFSRSLESVEKIDQLVSMLLVSLSTVYLAI
jgi:hypothetical protein